LPSRLRFVGCQSLPNIRLGNSELSCNSCWRDARFEGCTNGIYLTASQRGFRDTSSRWWDFLCAEGTRRVADCPVSTSILDNLPRRLISSSVAAWSESNSPSLKCLTALRRSLGNKWRTGVGSAVVSVAVGFGGDGGVSPAAAAEKRSGEICSSRSRSMARLWCGERWVSNAPRFRDQNSERAPV
jgi:hypothetical protein